MREVARIPIHTGVPRTGAAVYAGACAALPGVDRRGHDRAPSLSGIGARLTPEQVFQLVEYGRGFMPSFAGLPAEEKRAVIEYVVGKRLTEPLPASTAHPLQTSSPYEFVGYERWRDSAGFPAIRPAWGTLSAIDLNTGEIDRAERSEEHTSELQSQSNLVCRLLLEKKKTRQRRTTRASSSRQHSNRVQ